MAHPHRVIETLFLRTAWPALLAALPLVMAAPAEAEFGPPFTVSSAADARDPKVAVDADGDAVFVWRHDVLNWRILARSRSKGGKFGPTLQVSQTRTTKDASLHDVAVDAEGDAVFVWQLGVHPNSRVYGRTLSAGGALGPILTLSQFGTTHPPQVAVDADGDALFVWAQDRESVWARALSNAGVLGQAQLIAASNKSVWHPDVALDADGDAMIAWAHFGDTNSDSGIRARSRSKRGVLGQIQTVQQPPPGPLHYPQVAMKADGDAVIAWLRFGGGPDCERFKPARLQARVKTEGGFGPIRWISGPEDECALAEAFGEGLSGAEAYRIAMHAAGNSAFTWQGEDGTNLRVRARNLSVPGVPGPIQTLSAAGQDAQNPQVAVDADGNAQFAWHRHDGTTWRVQARTRSASGFLSRTENVSEAGQSAGPPHVAVAADAGAVITWHGATGTPSHRIFGAAAP
jgi:hypothetical protein